MLRDLLGDKVSASDFWRIFAYKFDDTSPMMREKTVTTAQASRLAKFLNVPVEDLEILNRAGASALIGTLIAMEPITDKQYYYLSEVMGFARDRHPSHQARGDRTYRNFENRRDAGRAHQTVIRRVIPASTSPTADLLS